MDNDTTLCISTIQQFTANEATSAIYTHSAKRPVEDNKEILCHRRSSYTLALFEERVHSLHYSSSIKKTIVEALKNQGKERPASINESSVITAKCSNNFRLSTFKHLNYIVF